MDWTNLYKNTKGTWLRGNLHTHSGEGQTQEEILSRYSELGYDFLCISDHMKLTVPQPPKGNKLMILTGFEWNSKTGEHMNLISFKKDLLVKSTRCHDQKTVMRWMQGQPALVVLNHPNWREPPHYSREELYDRPSAAGVEIYNGLIDFSAGTALATEKWDYLLSKGRRILGFANDDAHRHPHIGNAWTMVRAASRTPQAVFKALRAGNFYCSTGVTFDVIRRQGSVIEVSSRNAQEIWAVGEWGARIERVRQGHLSFDFAAAPNAAHKYVRFVAFGKGATQAWTQPFFKTAPVENKRGSAFIANWKLSRLLPVPLSSIQAPRLTDASLQSVDIKAAVAPEGFVDVSRLHGHNDGVCLLGARVTVAKAGSWLVGLGHDGGARLFVDGKLVIDQPTRINPAVPDRSRALLRLARGKHELVVALHTDSGKGQGIFLRFMIPSSVKKLPRVPVFPKPSPKL